MTRLTDQEMCNTAGCIECNAERAERIIDAAREKMGFLSEQECDILRRSQYSTLRVLVRCGGGRFVCTIEELRKRIKRIESNHDYVRDVSCVWHQGNEEGGLAEIGR